MPRYEKEGLERLKQIVDNYMSSVSGLKEHCDRCLRTERWDGNVTLMVIDAAFTSIGLNYFTAVVPKVEEFRRKFVEKGKIKTLKELAKANIDELQSVWRNRRSWLVAKNTAAYLSTLNGDDKKALRTWASMTKLENWREDPVGAIKGVGLITFQYLRMMGGIDTVMPDKIVKRVINEILVKAGLEPVNDDIAFIKCSEELARKCGYRPIELCWMTWMVQREGEKMRMEKYRDILSRI
ncbi:hypothetical protein H5T51_03980 [Candidatus Bathyarchaeota archaeon]|nr:hypothetical protein [Candidatus Bathyarchaeota archaeon]